MSLLNFPSEVTIQLFQKMTIHERINLCMTHPRLWPLCFDRLLDRKSTATISLKELRQLYHQSRTEKERDQCFNPKILDRLRINNFNEVVHMNMYPENHQFFDNHKILQSFKGKIVLEGENEQFSEDFFQKFLSLIDRIEGNLLLTFVDVKLFQNDYGKRCAQTLSKKLERGERVFLMDLTETICLTPTLEEIFNYMKDKLVFLVSDSFESMQFKELWLSKTNSGANIETMIAMINEDRFVAEKEYLVNVLPLVKAAELPGGGRDIVCEECHAIEYSVEDDMSFYMSEPDWSDCAGCELK